MLRIAVLVVAALLLQDAPKPEARHPWAGFPTGSSLVLLRRLTENGRTREVKERWTVAQVNGLPELSTQVWSGDRWVTGQASVPHLPPLLPEEGCTAGAAAKDELLLGGTKVPALVTEYSLQAGRGQSARARVWRAGAIRVPYREFDKDGTDLALLPDVLKVEIDIERGRDSAAYRIAVTSGRESVKVGDREIACVVEESSLQEQREQVRESWTMKRWLSDEVPGRVVRRVREGQLRNAPVKLEEEVLEFEVKK